MSKITRLIRSGFAALAVITAVAATAPFLFPQTAIAKEHRDRRHESSTRDTTKDSTTHEKETRDNSRG